MGILAPSILSADFSKLGEHVQLISDAGAGLIHIDVMDGHFVPNISFGAAVMKSLDQWETSPYDVHLMIENPDQYIKDFVTEKTEFIVVHQEACRHLHRTIQNIKSHGIKAGVSINPATPVSSLECILSEVDLVLVMSVNPGFGGQKYIPYVTDKVRQLRKMIDERGLNVDIELDGGVTADNVAELMEAGANVFVAGSAVFAGDLTANVKKFMEILEK